MRRASDAVVHLRARGFLVLRPVCGATSIYPQRLTRDEQKVDCRSCLAILAKAKEVASGW